MARKSWPGLPARKVAVYRPRQPRTRMEQQIIRRFIPSKPPPALVGYMGIKNTLV